jgi:sugar lactone lactonase YvrE
MSKRIVFLFGAPAVTLGVLAAACGDDDNAVSPGPDAGRDVTTTTDTGTQPDVGQPDADAGVEKLTFTELAKFNAEAFELPEGVVMHGGMPLVSLAPQGALVHVLADGGAELFSSFTAPQDIFTVGLAVDGNNDVYVAVAATGLNPSETPGVYKIPGGGGDPAQFDDGAETMGFPNGLDFIGTDLMVSDSAMGSIFRVQSDGTTTVFKNDPAFAGDLAACGSPNAFAVGINGIAHDANFIYGVNFDKGIFFRVSRADLDAGGAVETLYQNCDFAGADGIAIDTNGTFIVANNLKNRIDRVTINGTTATWVTIGTSTMPTMQGPATPYIDTTGASRRLLVTCPDFGLAFTDAGAARPNLLSAPLP